MCVLFSIKVTMDNKHQWIESKKRRPFIKLIVKKAHIIRNNDNVKIIFQTHLIVRSGNSWLIARINQINFILNNIL